jgi:Transposase Tn5 dimerisation domain/Transposase DNA-binding
MEWLTLSDFPSLYLGDKRRDSRFVSIINNVVSKPSGSIPQQCYSWYQTKSVYNFLGNKQVRLKKIESAVHSHGKHLLGNIKKVLIAHDFSQISYANLQQTEGLGYLNKKESLGIVSFNSLAISPEGTPLSLVYQETFVRPIENYGKSNDRKKIKYEDKESFYWQKGMSALNKSLDSDIHKIHIADREADIYELFLIGKEANSDLLIRSTHDRKLDCNDYLWQHLDKTSVIAEAKIKIPQAHTTNKVEITVSIKYKKVTILKPANSKSTCASVELTGILLQQVSPKQDWQQEIVEWKLLTTLEILQMADALQCVQWYCYRWLIERFHYVLKSGTEVEKLQLEEATRLQKAIHIYSIAAIQLMKLTYLARATPEESCELVLTRDQWAVLYMLRTKKKELPNEPPTIEEAVKWIGGLGGHLGRKSDGPPGLKVIWRGYRQLMTAVEMYEVLQNRQTG